MPTYNTQVNSNTGSRQFNGLWRETWVCLSFAVARHYETSINYNWVSGFSRLLEYMDSFHFLKCSVHMYSFSLLTTVSSCHLFQDKKHAQNKVPLITQGLQYIYIAHLWSIIYSSSCIHYGSCPPVNVLSVVGEKVITVVGYQWYLVPLNYFQNPLVLCYPAPMSYRLHTKRSHILYM